MMDRDGREGMQRKRGATEKKKYGEGSENGLIVPLTQVRHDDSVKEGKGKGRQRFRVLGAIATRRPLLLFAAVVASALYVLRRSAPASHQRSQESIVRQRVGMGTVIYGTAWKGSDTARFVAESIRAGFRHVATAARHGKYNESGVGEGWTKAATEVGLSRENLFLQTMFVPFGSADLAPAVEKAANVEEDVRSSIQNSLANLRTTYLDAVLYYNVKNKLEPIEDVVAAWRVLEGYVHDGTIRYLGITNCHDQTYLQSLYDQVTVKPTIVQNRFHANRQFGAPLRPFLLEKNITWQMFWTLTGNGGTLGKKVTKELAQARGLTPQTFMYAFVLSIGGSPMIGTKSRKHMDDDLSVARKFEDRGVRAFFEDDDDRKSFAVALGKPDLVWFI